jgi:hypothetical protein
MEILARWQTQGTILYLLGSYRPLEFPHETKVKVAVVNHANLTLSFEISGEYKNDSFNLTMAEFFLIKSDDIPAASITLVIVNPAEERRDLVISERPRS